VCRAFERDHVPTPRPAGAVGGYYSTTRIG
jgi:hypothetical protein